MEAILLGSAGENPQDLQSLNIITIPKEVPVDPIILTETDQLGGSSRNYIPKGGLLGQVLAKRSDDNYDLEWIDMIGGEGSITFPIIGNTQTNALKLSTNTFHNDKGLIDLNNSLGAGNSAMWISNMSDGLGVRIENSGGGNALNIWNISTSTGQAIAITNEGSGDGIYVNVNGNAYGINAVTNSTTVPAIHGQTNGTIGGYGVHGYATGSASYGVYGTASANNGIGVGGFVNGGAACAIYGANAGGGWAGAFINTGSGYGISITLSSAVGTSGQAMYISRSISGTGNVTGDIININDTNGTSGTVSGAVLRALIEATERVVFNPRVATGNGVAYILDTHNILNQSGDKLISIKNHGNEKMYLDKDGILYTGYGLFAGMTTDYVGILYNQINVSIAGTIRMNFAPSSGDSGTAIAYLFDTSTNYQTAGAKLISVRNQNVEKFWIDWDGLVLGKFFTSTNGFAANGYGNNGGSLLLFASGATGGNGYAVTIQAATGTSGNDNGGNLFLKRGLKYSGGAGSNGSIYMGDGSVAHLDQNNTESTLVAIDATTGKLTRRTVASLPGGSGVAEALAIAYAIAL